MRTYLNSGVDSFVSTDGVLVFQNKVTNPTYPFSVEGDGVNYKTQLVSIFEEDGDYVVHSADEVGYGAVHRYPKNSLANALFNVLVLGNSREFLKLIHSIDSSSPHTEIKYISSTEHINNENLSLITSGYLEEKGKNYALISDMKPMFSMETVHHQNMVFACGVEGYMLAIDNQYMLVKSKNNNQISEQIKKTISSFIENLEPSQLNAAFKAFSVSLYLLKIKIADKEGFQEISIVEKTESSNTQLYKEILSTHALETEREFNQLKNSKKIKPQKKVIGNENDPICFEIKAISFGSLVEYTLHGELLCITDARNNIHALCVCDDQYYMVNASQLKIGEYNSYVEVAAFYGFNANATPEKNQVEFPLSVTRTMQDELGLPLDGLLCGKLPLPKDKYDTVYTFCPNVSSTMFEGAIIIGEKFVSFNTDLYEVYAYKHKNEVNLVVACGNVDALSALDSKHPNKMISNILDLQSTKRIGYNCNKPYICVNSTTFKDMGFILSMFLNPFITNKSNNKEVAAECSKIIDFLLSVGALKLKAF